MPKGAKRNGLDLGYKSCTMDSYLILFSVSVSDLSKSSLSPAYLSDNNKYKMLVITVYLSSLAVSRRHFN